MIYRVGDNEITSYDRKSLKTTPKSGSEEKFSLEYRSPETLKEKDKKDSQETKETVSGTAREEGVRLELSGQRNVSAADSRSLTGAAKPVLQTSLGIRDFFHQTVSAIKDFFYKIWNDVPTEEKVENASPDMGKAPVTAEELTKDIKYVARNSDLVTYYDRSGKLVQPNASDKERILHGDRNVKKL